MSAENSLRRIQVNDLDYLWKASMIDPQYALVDIWLDGNAFQESPIRVRCRFDEPWRDIGLAIGVREPDNRDLFPPIFQPEPLTPDMIRYIIEAARRAGWRPETEHKALHFEWQSSGSLREVPDATVPGEDPFGLRMVN